MSDPFFPLLPKRLPKVMVKSPNLSLTADIADTIKAFFPPPQSAAAAPGGSRGW